MRDTLRLRTALIGLIGFAAVEEEMLLALAGSDPEEGSPQHWAAVPLVAHNAEFKRQQAQRLEAVRLEELPPTFAEVDHSSADLYRHYSEQSATSVASASREATQALVDGVRTITDEDLLDPSRNTWLAGRKLWLQVVVRGFWHPTGHLGEYYLAHAQPDRAVALQRQAVAVAVYLGAPGEARAMACYNLACATARADLGEHAVSALSEAISLNPDLRANARKDADLSRLREAGLLDVLLAAE